MDISKINRDGSNQQNSNSPRKRKKKEDQNSANILSESLEINSEEKEDTNLEQNSVTKNNPARKSIDIKV